MAIIFLISSTNMNVCFNFSQRFITVYLLVFPNDSQLLIEFMEIDYGDGFIMEFLSYFAKTLWVFPTYLFVCSSVYPYTIREDIISDLSYLEMMYLLQCGMLNGS